MILNKIPFTQEHLLKLRVMVEKLFPDFVYKSVHSIQIDSGPNVIGIDQTSPTFVYLSETENEPHDDGRYIHWFEFCMGILAGRIEAQLTEAQSLDISEDALSKIKGSICPHKYFWDRYMSSCSPNRFHNGDTYLIHPVDFLYQEFKKPLTK